MEIIIVENIKFERDLITMNLESNSYVAYLQIYIQQKNVFKRS